MFFSIEREESGSRYLEMRFGKVPLLLAAGCRPRVVLVAVVVCGSSFGRQFEVNHPETVLCYQRVGGACVAIAVKVGNKARRYQCQRLLR